MASHDITYYCGRRQGGEWDPQFCMWLYGRDGSHVEGTVMLCNLQSLGGAQELYNSLLWYYGGKAYISIDAVKWPEVGQFTALYMQAFPDLMVIQVQEMVTLNETSALYDGGLFFGKNMAAQLLASKFVIKNGP